MAKRNTQGVLVRSDAGKVVFLASTDALATDGLIIEKSAWDLSRFKRNPLIMWSHRYDMPPIGRASDVRMTDAGLEVTVEFDEQDSFAAEIARKVRQKWISAVSVGFNILKQAGNRVTQAELLEISVVPIPADPNALAIARSAYQRSRGGSSAQYSTSDLQAVSKALDRFEAQLKRKSTSKDQGRGAAFKAMVREVVITDGLRRMNERERRAFLAACTVAELHEIDRITRKAFPA